MEESIFFNRGNAIASNIDLKALYEEVQKAKKKTDKKKKYVIVKKNFEYFLFEEAYFNILDNQSDYEVIEYV